ncbi:MAG: hypothetical protein LC119_07020, partial [Burkholderiales bacterium]|nr:hypothetical protein [Burkholderiales bacterium]
PAERAYLMHYAWKIAKQNLDASKVPAMPGVDIQWQHATPAASKLAASQMVADYGIVYAPVLTSRHSQRRAIDMTISNYSGKTFTGADGKATVVKTAADLHALGRGFGVHKLASDPPHWSDDGH